MPEASLCPGLGVEVPCLTIFARLRLDSLPLASERVGDPGRLIALTRRVSECFSLRPDGVFAPLDDAPDGGLVPSFGLLFGSCFAFSSSSASRLRSSSLVRSASESSLSL
jgi:hypothetical protein